MNEKLSPWTTADTGEDDQTARIQENVREYQDNWRLYTLSDFEEIFEDRDPFEFL